MTSILDTCTDLLTHFLVTQQHIFTHVKIIPSSVRARRKCTMKLYIWVYFEKVLVIRVTYRFTWIKSKRCKKIIWFNPVKIKMMQQIICCLCMEARNSSNLWILQKDKHAMRNPLVLTAIFFTVTYLRIKALSCFWFFLI